jgi:Na+-driven multidrug efflux pump
VGRDRAPWWLRLTAWIVAVPLGLALVGIPARKAGYLSSQRLLDIVIGRGFDRYISLGVIVLLWALVTALLVQVIVEGGRVLRRRRRRRRMTVTEPDA